MEVPTRVAIRINSSGPTASGAGDASQVLLLDSEARIQALHALRQWRKLDGGPMVNEAHLRHEDRPFANQAGRRPCDGNIHISEVTRAPHKSEPCADFCCFNCDVPMGFSSMAGFPPRVDGR